MQTTTTRHYTETKKPVQVAALWLIAFVAVLFIILFSLTAMSKLWDVPKFTSVMQKPELIQSYAAFLAYAVPIDELIVSVLLAFSFIPLGEKRKSTLGIGLKGAALFMFLFTCYVIITLVLLPTNLPCTCGGFISNIT